MSDKYDDIINLPRPESKYPRMPRANRAAQFSPFAALTGHEEAIRETAYLLTEQIKLKKLVQPIHKRD
mgnify:CR=1 FL=1